MLISPTANQRVIYLLGPSISTNRNLQSKIVSLKENFLKEDEENNSECQEYSLDRAVSQAKKHKTNLLQATDNPSALIFGIGCFMDDRVALNALYSLGKIDDDQFDMARENILEIYSFLDIPIPEIFISALPTTEEESIMKQDNSFYDALDQAYRKTIYRNADVHSVENENFSELIKYHEDTTMAFFSKR